MAEKSKTSNPLAPELETTKHRAHQLHITLPSETSNGKCRHSLMHTQGNRRQKHSQTVPSTPDDTPSVRYKKGRMVLKQRCVKLEKPTDHHLRLPAISASYSGRPRYGISSESDDNYVFVLRFHESDAPVYNPASEIRSDYYSVYRYGIRASVSAPVAKSTRSWINQRLLGTSKTLHQRQIPKLGELTDKACMDVPMNHFAYSTHPT